MHYTYLPYLDFIAKSCSKHQDQVIEANNTYINITPLASVAPAYPPPVRLVAASSLVIV